MPKQRPKSLPPQISAGDLPLSEIEISGIHFHIEFIDVPDAAQRWNSVVEHLGNWHLATWEIETNEHPDRFYAQVGTHQHVQPAILAQDESATQCRSVLKSALGDRPMGTRRGT
jgi:hypothetical protein